LYVTGEVWVAVSTMFEKPDTGPLFTVSVNGALLTGAQFTGASAHVFSVNVLPVSNVAGSGSTTASYGFGWKIWMSWSNVSKRVVNSRSVIVTCAAGSLIGAVHIDCVWPGASIGGWSLLPQPSSEGPLLNTTSPEDGSVTSMNVSRVGLGPLTSVTPVSETTASSTLVWSSPNVTWMTVWLPCMTSTGESVVVWSSLSSCVVETPL
jgi:hypothetical protein